MPAWEYIDVIEDDIGFAIELTKRGSEGYRAVMMDKLEDGRRRATMERMVLNV